MESAWVKESEVVGLVDIVYDLPGPAIDVENFNSGYKLVGLRLDGGALAQGLATEGKDVLLIEEADTVSLSRLAHRRELGPLVILDRVDLAGGNALNRGDRVLLEVHASKDIDLISVAEHGMISSFGTHLLHRYESASIVVQNEEVVHEHFKHGLEATDDIEMAVGGHEVSALVGEWKGVLDGLDLTVVVQHLKGVVELGVTLDEDEMREDVGVEPVPQLVVPREACSHELLELVLKSLERAGLSEAEILVVSVDTIVLIYDVLIVIYYR